MTKKLDDYEKKVELFKETLLKSKECKKTDTKNLRMLSLARNVIERSKEQSVLIVNNTRGDTGE
jgi:hypothetical protein